MVNFTIFAGGYTAFIASYLFNSDAPSLSLLAQSPSGQNPSWIISHPTNLSILYATNEVEQGLLQSYLVNPSGSLTGPTDSISSGGNGPAFCGPVSDTQVAVLNFGSGDGLIVPTTADPDIFTQNAPLITFPVPSGTASRPHMALPFNDEVFVADLGADTIWRLAEQSPNNYQIVGSIPQPAGSGPRHFAIQDEFIYVLHEITSTLTAQKIPSDPTSLDSPILATTSIIPSNPPIGSKFAAAEILIPPTTPQFPTPLIYVSNRNIGTGKDPRGDSIAIFEHVIRDASSSYLSLVAQVFTGLDQIRGMQFGRVEDGGVEFLVASGFAGRGGVVVFKRVDGGRNLVEVARNTDVLTRTSFVWV